MNEIKNLQETAESYDKKLDYIAQIQQKSFGILADTLSSGFLEIASVIEWGFDEISWQLQQQTEVLRSISYTLKTPSETKANEWRLQAEELRRRSVLKESEEFFLKALNEYRLDYRTYIGLVKTYLQMNKFDKAEVLLERSLPHAPKGEIDYKSYSYRLIGHIHACKEDYEKATTALQYAIKLSPHYADGHYDYAQYCAQTRKREDCLFSLRTAVSLNPFYWYLAQKERNFDPMRSEVNKLLFLYRVVALNEVQNNIGKSEAILMYIEGIVSQVQEDPRYKKYVELGVDLVDLRHLVYSTGVRITSSRNLLKLAGLSEALEAISKWEILLKIVEKIKEKLEQKERWYKSFLASNPWYARLWRGVEFPKEPEIKSLNEDKLKWEKWLRDDPTSLFEKRLPWNQNQFTDAEKTVGEDLNEAVKFLASFKKSL